MRKRLGSPPSITQKQNSTVITQVREYKLITPLFGGGVTPKEADPVTIIRGTEIRGQLRFWWRASRGWRFDGNLTEMKKAESKLWGAAYKKGEEVPQNEIVQIQVEAIKKNSNLRPEAPPSYAAFPLLPTEQEKKQAGFKPKEVLYDITFTLTISFPESQKDEVDAALWSWETFGGIGARTRRGFGALQLLKIDGKDNSDLPFSNQARDWIEKKLTSFIKSDRFPVGVPHLSSTTQSRTTAPTQNPISTWRTLINKLLRFRQARYGERGRSQWPESQAIRDITQRENSTYQTQHFQKFPRAAFGLPIIFHFTDKGAPSDTTLQGADKGSERLASPLILRPLACKNNQYVGLALLLEGPRTPPKGLLLAEKNRQVDSALTPKEASTIPILKGRTDVLQAFLDFIEGEYTR